EGIPAHGDRPGRVAEPLDVEPADLPLESALAEQHLTSGQVAVVEVQLAPVLAVHELRRSADDEAGCVAVDEYRSDAADAGTESDVDQEDAGLGAVRREHLRAVDDETIPAGRGRRRQIGDSRTRLGLTH